jgi:hypothetical protein
MTRMRTALVVCACAGLLLVAQPVHAQYSYRPASSSDAATGETYHVEFGGNFWAPTPEIVISSEGLGHLGTDIDFVNDLGIEKERFGELRLVLRPARKHKFRFHYIPIQYKAESIVTREIVFNGIVYTIGLPVASEMNWKSYRIGYEFDFLYRDRWFAGFIFDVKYTDVDVTLSNQFLGTEFTRARGPIPTIGGIFRGYVIPNISITAEVTGFKLPERIDEDYRGSYIDVDVYGTVNLTDHVGFQAGYRSLDVNYRVEDDAGDLKLKGPYFGGVVRF